MTQSPSKSRAPAPNPPAHSPGLNHQGAGQSSNPQSPNPQSPRPQPAPPPPPPSMGQAIAPLRLDSTISSNAISSSAISSSDSSSNGAFSSPARAQASAVAPAVASAVAPTVAPQAPSTLQGSKSNQPSGLSRWWSQLSLKTKLVLLIVGSAALPLVVTTQGLVTLNKNRALQDAKAAVEQQGSAFRGEYVEWTLVENRAKALSLADLIQATQTNPSNAKQVQERQKSLNSYVALPQLASAEIDTSFKLITNAWGRTVVQDIRYFKSPTTEVTTVEQAQQRDYETVNVATGINLSQVPIIKAAIASGKPLSGIEILDAQTIQQLGLADQARVPLTEAQGPSAQILEGGKAALVSVAVHPIKASNGQLLGLSVAGTMLNNFTALADLYRVNYDAGEAGIFAQDILVASTQVQPGGQGRLAGIASPSEVSNTVLQEGEESLQSLRRDNHGFLGHYSPIYDHQKDLNPDQAKPVGMVYVGQSLREVEERFLIQQMTAYGIGAGMLGLIALLSLPAAGAIATPLSRLSQFAQQVGTGRRGLRLDEDVAQSEIGQLTVSLNRMVQNLELNETRLSRELAQSKLLSAIASLRTLNHGELMTGLGQVLESVRLNLGCDRLVVYRCADSQHQGQAVAEAVLPRLPSAIALNLSDQCISSERLQEYRQGRVVSVADISRVSFDPEHLKLLQTLQVRSILILPILTDDHQLYGLLIAHYCQRTHSWQPHEQRLLETVASQISSVLAYASVVEGQRQAQAELEAEKAKLQRRALELLQEVDPVAQGDLTVRATVTEDEIGTVADSYNSMVASLRKIVTQVQASSGQVAQTTSHNEAAIQSLAQEAIQQAEQIGQALQRLEGLTHSVEAIAADATQAQIAVEQTSQTVRQGDATMTRAVEGMLSIRQSVSETTRKMEGLGDASARISQVIQLIANFAAQTHMLALKASIEAARAGERGQGFAVIAEEVRMLASQSAQATADVEAMINSIQSATQDVITAMRIENEQVAQEVSLVDETRASLTQITQASAQVNQLVAQIAETTVQHTQESEAITQTMTDIASTVRQTAAEATLVTDSFQHLLQVAQALQAEVARFKVS